MFFFLQNICGKKKQFSSFIIILRKKKTWSFFFMENKRNQTDRVNLWIQGLQEKKSFVEKQNNFLRKVIWLILPVAICLFKGLSHACVSINEIF